MGLFLTMMIFFVITTMVFLAIAVFLPEWLGITGTHAKKIIKEQQEQSSSEQKKEAPEASSQNSNH